MPSRHRETAGRARSLRRTEGSQTRRKTPSIAESADKPADAFVSEDGRYRNRLARIGTRWLPMNFNEFWLWL